MNLINSFRPYTINFKTVLLEFISALAIKKPSFSNK